ncbi:flagella synthesis protein FlgN [Nitrosomonas sp.]|uniref:flagella synthesis protein FlgN n=1 Tax=Nitrosomonas sp. TaxID=42353 RepID=UPI001D351AEF|nr:flagellar protein FlgN [Nitrosomonas sp.]MBX3617458.1 flagellar protein FlgN [Nitrosomonas sp.]
MSSSLKSFFPILNDLLLKEINELHSFIDILRKEEQALIGGRIEEIDLYSSDKLRLIEVLTQLSNQRDEYLKGQGINLDENSINSWLEKQPSDQLSTKEAWNDLLNLARTVRQQNHSNGLIIASRLQHHQRALAALHSAAGNVSCYGPKGQAYI